MLQRLIVLNDRIPLSPYVSFALPPAYLFLALLTFRYSGNLWLDSIRDQHQASASLIIWSESSGLQTPRFGTFISCTCIPAEKWHKKQTKKEIMSTCHLVQHRSNMCPHAAVYPVIFDMPSFYNHLHHCFQQSAMRRLLHQQSLRAGGRYNCDGTQPSGKRVPCHDWMATNGAYQQIRFFFLYFRFSSFLIYSVIVISSKSTTSTWFAPTAVEDISSPVQTHPHFHPRTKIKK